MPQLPLQLSQRTAGLNPQAPQVSQAQFSLDEFFQGVASFAFAVQAKENANAGPRGRRKALDLYRDMLPDVNEFHKANRAKPDYDKNITDFWSRTLTERMENVDLGSNPREREAFHTKMSELLLGDTRGRMTDAAKAFQEDQLRIVNENIDGIVPGAIETDDDVILESAVVGIHTELEEASNETGVISPQTAVESLYAATDKIFIERMIRKDKDPDLVAALYDGERTITIPRPMVDKDFKLLRRSDGTVKFDHHLLTGAQKEVIAETIDKRIARERRVKDNRLALHQDIRDERKRAVKAGIYKDIAEGSLDAAESMFDVLDPDTGDLMFDPQTEIRDAINFQNSIQDRVANRPTTDHNRLLELMDTANSGLLSLGSLHFEHGIGTTDRKELAKMQLEAENNMRDKDYTQYKQQLSDAEESIKQRFGVHGLFADKQTAHFVPDVLIAFHERLRAQVEKARTEAQFDGSQDSPFKRVNPGLIAEQIMTERLPEYGSILVPVAQKQAKVLGRYFRTIEHDESHEKSLQSVVDLVKGEVDSGRIGPIEAQRTLFVLAALELQGMNYDTIRESIESSSDFGIQGAVKFGDREFDNVTKWQRVIQDIISTGE